MDAHLNADDLAAYIRENQVDAEIVFLAQPTPTVAAAAAAVGVAAEQIVKSVLFMIREGGEEDRPVLVIGHGAGHIERRALAQYLEVGRKRVRLAGEEQVLQYTGYAAGTVPPFGHPQPLRTLMDAGITRLDEVYAGGGDINALIRLKVAELQRVVSPEIVDLS